MFQSEYKVSFIIFLVFTARDLGTIYQEKGYTPLNPEITTDSYALQLLRELRSPDGEDLAQNWRAVITRWLDRISTMVQRGSNQRK